MKFKKVGKMFTSKRVFDGGNCTTLNSDPDLVVMREESGLVFKKFIQGEGWGIVRLLTESEIKELHSHKRD